MDKCRICGMAFVGSKELAEHVAAAHTGGMIQCQSCGRLFDREGFERHRVIHGIGRDFSKTAPAEEEEFRLRRRADEEEQARSKTRGPYRKSHVA